MNSKQCTPLKTTVSLLLITLLLAFPICTLTSCDEKSIPNVMGVAHEEAKTVLENAGFEVSEIEADASEILPNTSWNRSVKKDIVFKVNDETNPDYGKKAIAKDNKVVIYYAKEDYVYEKPTDDQKTDDTASKESPQASPSTSNVSWKQFLKDYEKWVDDYIVIMEKYTKNPTDITILSDYMQCMQDIVEWSERADKIEEELEDDLVAQKEYIEMLARIVIKLNSIG